MYLTCLYGKQYELYGAPALRFSMAIWLIIISISASTINVLVIVSIWKNSSLHKPSYVLLTNLACCDLLNSLINGPLTAYINIVLGKNELHCQAFIISKAMSYLASAVTIGTLSGISFDRLLAVSLKNRYQTKVTVKRVAASLIMYWVAPFTTCLAFVSGFNLEAIKLFLFLSGVGTFLYLIQIAACYTLAHLRLRKMTSSIAPQARDNSTHEHISKYRKTIHTMVIICIVILVSYVPFLCASINILSYCDGDVRNCYLFLEIGELIVASNSIVNPLMYLWQMRELRQTVKNLISNITSFIALI